MEEYDCLSRLSPWRNFQVAKGCRSPAPLIQKQTGPGVRVIAACSRPFPARGLFYVVLSGDAAEGLTSPPDPSSG